LQENSGHTKTKTKKSIWIPARKNDPDASLAESERVIAPSHYSPTRATSGRGKKGGKVSQKWSWLRRGKRRLYNKEYTWIPAKRDEMATSLAAAERVTGPWYYGVATISRLLQIIRLVCRISSLL